MITLEEIYEEDPTQRIIDEGADWGAKEMLRRGVPIFYRDEEFPETLEGDLFVKEYTTGARFIVRKILTRDLCLFEETIRAVNPIKRDLHICI